MYDIYPFYRLFVAKENFNEIRLNKLIFYQIEERYEKIRPLFAINKCHAI